MSSIAHAQACTVRRLAITLEPVRADDGRNEKHDANRCPKLRLSSLVASISEIVPKISNESAMDCESAPPAEGNLRDLGGIRT